MYFISLVDIKRKVVITTMIYSITTSKGKDGIRLRLLGIIQQSEPIILLCNMMANYIYLEGMMEKLGLVIFINAI